MLEPYLQRVGAFLRARGDENRSITIPSGPAPLTLSAEERKAAWSVLCDASADWADPQAWIALGAGLHLAVATVLEEISQPDQGDNQGQAAQRLVALRAVAASFTEGLRQAIVAMVGSGRAEEVKRFSSFRNKLLETLALLRSAGASAPSPVAEVAPAAPAEPVVQEPPSAEVPEIAAVADAPAAADPALAPYLERAAAFLRARGNEDRPLAIMFGRRMFTVTTWQRRVLWHSLCDGEAPARDWHRLIPQCIALQLAMLLSLDELEQPGRSPKAEHAARLDLQATLRLSSSVVDGFRAEIGRSVGAGAVEDAKTMSAVRSDFAATLVEARRVLAEETAAISSGAAARNGSDDRSDATAPAPPSTVDVTESQDSQLTRLKPFLDRATHLLEMRGREDRPLSIPVGGRSWSLDTWERRVLWKVLCEEGPPPPDWCILLAHGAAAHLAALLALERLRKAGAAPEARAAAEADRDTALQLASEILERLQTTAERLMADGQAKLAEQLTRFRAKLAESIQLLHRTR